MVVVHCTMGYHRFNVTKLDTQADEVYNGVYNNPTSFPSPPVTATVFHTKKQTFSDAAADYATYGLVKKTEFIHARTEMIDTLDQTANYVDGVANGDISIIVLSGFAPSSSDAKKKAPLGKIEVFNVKRTDNPGEIAVEIAPIVNNGVSSYYCICSEEPIDHLVMNDGQLNFAAVSKPMFINFSKSRRKVFKQLTPGVMYYFYVFATNTVSVSAVSDVRSLMAA